MGEMGSGSGGVYKCFVKMYIIVTQIIIALCSVKLFYFPRLEKSHLLCAIIKSESSSVTGQREHVAFKGPLPAKPFRLNIVCRSLLNYCQNTVHALSHAVVSYCYVLQLQNVRLTRQYWSSWRLPMEIIETILWILSLPRFGSRLFSRNSGILSPLFPTVRI